MEYVKDFSPIGRHRKRCCPVTFYRNIRGTLDRVERAHKILLELPGGHLTNHTVRIAVGGDLVTIAGNGSNNLRALVRNPTQYKKCCADLVLSEQRKNSIGVAANPQLGNLPAGCVIDTANCPFPDGYAVLGFSLNGSDTFEALGIDSKVYSATGRVYRPWQKVTMGAQYALLRFIRPPRTQFIAPQPM